MFVIFIQIVFIFFRNSLSNYLSSPKCICCKYKCSAVFKGLIDFEEKLWNDESFKKLQQLHPATGSFQLHFIKTVICFCLCAAVRERVVMREKKGRNRDR